MDQIYEKGQLIQVRISDAAEEEKCFGRLDNGMSVFVRGQIAVGDLVEAEIFKIKKKFLEARFTRLLEPAPTRTDPRCSHFGTCGGCKWQHVSYEAQLEIKQKKVADALAHIAGLRGAPVSETLPAARPFGYRNKVDLSFSDKRYLLADELNLPEDQLEKSTHFALGFHAPRQYAKVLDVDTCHIATDAMNTVLHTVKKFGMEKELKCYSSKTHGGFLRNLVVRDMAHSGQLMVNIVTSWFDEPVMQELLAVLQAELGDKLTTLVNNISTRMNNSAFGEEEHVLYGPGVVTEQLGDLTFEVSANSFFQTNSQQALALYEGIRKAVDAGPDEIIYDLYCGTGSISLFVARDAKKVLGIECIEDAVKDAHRNAEMNKIENCTFRVLDMKDFKKIKPDLEAFGLPQTVIADPPRAGMHPKALATLIEMAPAKIVYVSCNPANLGRDAKELVAGGYALRSVQPIDMFPHTHHIESIAVFERGA